MPERKTRLQDSNIFENLGLNKKDIDPKIINFISKRLYDPGLRRGLDRFSLELKQEDIRVNRITITKQPPIPVLASWTEKFLKRKGFNNEVFFDIGNVFSANQLAESFGDGLIYQVCEFILRNLPENSYLIRVGGDEFKIVFKDEQQRERIQGLITEASKMSYFFSGENYQFAIVSNTIVSQKGQESLKKEKDKPSLDSSFEERVKRIKERKKDLLSEGFEESDENRLLLEILEEILFDPVLEKASKTIMKQKEGLSIEVFKNPEDLIENLGQGDFSFLKIEFPGLLKLVNDKSGYQKGDELIVSLFNQIVNVLYERGIKDFKVWRRGGDFFIVFNRLEELEEQQVSLSHLNIEFEIEGVRRNLPTIFLSSLTNFSFGENNTENKNRFYQAFERLFDGYWDNFKKLIIDFIKKDDLTDDDWWYLGYLFNPYDKRGILRLKRLGIDDDFINILKCCFDNYQKKDYELGDYEGQINLFKRVLKSIFQI